MINIYRHTYDFLPLFHPIPLSGRNNRLLKKKKSHQKRKRYRFVLKTPKWFIMLGLLLFPPLLPQTKPIRKVYLTLTECIFWWVNVSIKVFFPPSFLNSLHYSLEEKFLQKKLITIREITAHQSPTQLNAIPMNELLPNDMNCPILVWQVTVVAPTRNKIPTQKTY